MEIDYDYLRTGTAIGFRVFRELCSNYLSGILKSTATPPDKRDPSGMNATAGHHHAQTTGRRATAMKSTPVAGQQTSDFVLRRYVEKEPCTSYRSDARPSVCHALTPESKRRKLRSRNFFTVGFMKDSVFITQILHQLCFITALCVELYCLQESPEGL